MDYATRSMLTETTAPHAEWVGACWISPTGDVFPVRYAGHSEKAGNIWLHHLKRTEEKFWDADDLLLDQGWKRLETDGTFYQKNERMNDKQFEVVFDMLMRGKQDEETAKHLDGDYLPNLEKAVRRVMEREASAV